VAGRSARPAPLVLRPDHRPRGEHDHGLDQVPELPDVAGPVVPEEDLHRVGGEPLEVAVVVLRELVDEPAHQHGNVVAAVAQRGQLELQHV